MNDLIQWKKGAQYWDKAWNPIVGCQKVSEGCQNCYAERLCQKFGMNGESGFVPTLKPAKNPPRSGVVFVGNMTDIFGEWNSDAQILEWLHYLPCTGTYLVLTKRSDRLARLAPYWCGNAIIPGSPHWFGITAENQTRYVERMAWFWDLGLSRMWLSLEPLLGAINLRDMGDYYCPKCNSGFYVPDKYITPCCGAEIQDGNSYCCPECGNDFDEGTEIPVCPICGNSGGSYIQPDHIDCFGRYDLAPLKNIGWVVIGAESGPDSVRRPCKLEWVESIVQQCQKAEIPVFVKQLEMGGRLVKDIEKFPSHLQIRQVPWEVKR